jgi:hypothetical protein
MFHQERAGSTGNPESMKRDTGSILTIEIHAIRAQTITG